MDMNNIDGIGGASFFSAPSDAAGSTSFGEISGDASESVEFSALLSEVSSEVSSETEVVNSEAAFSAVSSLSNDETELLAKIESLSEIDALLKRVSALLGLNVDMEKSLYRVDPEEIPEEMIAQLADFLAGMKEFTELLQQSGSTDVPLELNGHEFVGEEITALTNQLVQETLNLEVQFSKLGISEEISLEMAKLQNESKGSGILVASNPTDLLATQPQIPESLRSLLEKEETQLETIIGNIRKLASAVNKEGGEVLADLAGEGEAVKDALSALTSKDSVLPNKDHSLNTAKIPSVVSESIAVGSESLAVGSESVAVGSESVAVSSESIAVSSESVAVSSESVAVSSESVAVSSDVETVLNEGLEVTSEGVAAVDSQIPENQMVQGEAGVAVESKSKAVASDAVVSQVELNAVQTEATSEDAEVVVTTSITGEMTAVVNEKAETVKQPSAQVSKPVIENSSIRSEQIVSGESKGDSETESEEGSGDTEQKNLFSQFKQGGISAGNENRADQGVAFSMNNESISAEELNQTDASRSRTPRSFDRMVMDQVSNKLATGAKEGAREVTVVLKPEMLGQVKVTILVEGDVVSAKIQVENPQVKQIVENNFNSLRDALAESGLKTGALDVNVGNGETPDDRQASNQGKARRRKTGLPAGLDEFEEDPFEPDFFGKETGKRYGNNSVEYFA